MAAVDDLQTTWTEKEQAADAFEVRAALENCTTVLDDAHQTVQDIVDSGSFSTLPTDLKNTLNDWWTIVKAARTSIGGDADIMAVYNWRP